MRYTTSLEPGSLKGLEKCNDDQTGAKRAARRIADTLNAYFEGRLVGGCFADNLVEDKVIIELKSVTVLAKAHEVQLVNYLKATGMKVGLLINFVEKLAFKRRIIS
jgi:GxxExxY protein